MGRCDGVARFPNLTRRTGLSTCPAGHVLCAGAMVQDATSSGITDAKTNKEKFGRTALSRWFIAAAMMAALLATGSASAQSGFPAKPVHVLVPYAAGGAVDILARTFGEAVSRQWGQSVVVDNRPGAGGVIASQALATSPPDGYTLMLVASGHPTNPFLYAKLPYDTFKDFTPISLLASSPNILLVRDW